MANVVYSTAASSSNKVWYGSITSRSATEIVWGDGTYETSFLGHYTYRGTTIVGGTLSQYQQTIGGDTYVTVTGLNFLAVSMQSLWNLGSRPNFYKAIFAGNDSITGSDDHDVLSGFGAGKDTINGGDGDDTITGGAGNDSIVGGDGIDVLSGGGGTTDTITGGDGDDQITAGGNAVVNGGVGSDSYFVSSGIVRITEPTGNTGDLDEVTTKYSYALSDNIERLTLTGTGNASGTGNSGDNVLVGNSGANFLRGNGGNDVMNGGIGNDTLSGGLGTDTLTGGVSDILEGGAGKDVFLFDFVPNATTTITEIVDFSPGDRIALNFRTLYDITDRYIGFQTAGNFKAAQFYDTSTDLPTALDDFGEVDAVATAALQLKIRITYDPTTGILMYDPDGVGTHVDPVETGPNHAPILVDLPAVQIAVVDGAPTLRYQDFYVIKL